MKKGETRALPTAKVIASSAAATAAGQVAIVLHTKSGAMAFEVNQQAIDALRRDLAAAEQMLRQVPGKA